MAEFISLACCYAEVCGTVLQALSSTWEVKLCLLVYLLHDIKFCLGLAHIFSLLMLY